MAATYHILNGDALRERFPDAIAGIPIVAREALVDGPVAAATLPEFWQLRAAFLSTAYGGTIDDYFINTLAEFEKIQQIPPRSNIHLWFEDDLFCQVNFWFTAYLIRKAELNAKVYLVRPARHNQYGFGGLGQEALIAIFEQRKMLNELDVIADLWVVYQQGDLIKLANQAKYLATSMPFVQTAVQAHIDRFSVDKSPLAALTRIMKELGTDAFGPVFKAFSERYSIYGFGDLQVKRLYDDIINHHQDSNYD